MDKNNNFPPAERLTMWAPFAKVPCTPITRMNAHCAGHRQGFGGMLDLNCAVIVIPVCRTTLRV